MPSLRSLHLRKIQARVLAVDAFAVRVHEALPDVGRLEQALVGMQPTSRQVPPSLACLLDERGFQSVLAGAYGRGVAAGTTPDDNQVVGHFFPFYIRHRLQSRCVYHKDMRVLLFLMLACGAGFASPQTANSRLAGGAAKAARTGAPARWPIASIAIDGNHIFTREQVLAVAGLRVGQVAGKADFEAARDRLLASGAFETVGYKFVQAPDGKGYAATLELDRSGADLPRGFPGSARLLPGPGRRAAR